MASFDKIPGENIATSWTKAVAIIMSKLCRKSMMMTFFSHLFFFWLDSEQNLREFTNSQVMHEFRSSKLRNHWGSGCWFAIPVMILSMLSFTRHMTTFKPYLGRFFWEIPGAYLSGNVYKVKRCRRIVLKINKCMISAWGFSSVGRQDKFSPCMKTTNIYENLALKQMSITVDIHCL